MKIYRIECDVHNMIDILFQNLSKSGHTMYKNGFTYYMCNLDKNEVRKTINKLFKQHKDNQVFVKEIDKNTGDLYIDQWINKNLMNDEKARFEKEQQQALLYFNKFMDDYQKALDSQLKRKEETNAKTTETES